MRNLKFSFALVIAILAVGFTIASKANQLGSRAITDCFKVVLLQDQSGTTILDPAQYASQTPATCAETRSHFIDNGIVYLSAQPVNLADIDNSCIPTRPQFCCVTFVEDLTNPAGVPLVDLGDGVARKYKVQEIKCKQ